MKNRFLKYIFNFLTVTVIWGDEEIPYKRKLGELFFSDIPANAVQYNEIKQITIRLNGE